MLHHRFYNIGMSQRQNKGTKVTPSRAEWLAMPKKWTPEQRAKAMATINSRTAAQKALTHEKHMLLWSDPDRRAKARATTLAQWDTATPEQRQLSKAKQSAAQKLRREREHPSDWRKLHKCMCSSDCQVLVRGKFASGHNLPLIRNNPEVKAKLSAASRLRWQNPEYKARLASMRRTPCKPATKKKISRAAKAQWRNPISAQKLIDGSTHFPNKLEQAMIATLDGLGLEYTSNTHLYSYQIDFLLHRYHLVIETDGTYWHSRSEIVRKDKLKDKHLKASGFTVLRFSDTDLANAPSKVRKKILATVKKLSAKEVVA